MRAHARRLGLGVVLSVALTSVIPMATATAQPVIDPTELVNPFIGTGTGGQFVGSVNTFPGAVAPFGMLSWSPETSSRPTGGGYNYDDSAVTGLSLTHLSGVGCPIQGDLPILPTVGAIEAAPARTTKPFSHADEVAKPGYYRTKLDGVDVRVAATQRTGVGEFGFPASTQSNFLFKTGSSQNGNTTATVSIQGPDRLSGSITSGRFCARQNNYTLYYAAVFDRPFTSHGTWQANTVTPGAKETAGPGSGAWVTFDTTQKAEVGLKVAISYVSAANAWANLQAENPGWGVDPVAARTKAAWHRLLSTVEIEGGTRDQRIQFYTALYHSLLHPNVFSDVNGQYIGFDNKVHTLPPGKVQYANFSGWDVYRTLIQLQALIAPTESSQMMQSLVNNAAQGGWLPKWPVANGYTGVMNGDAAVPMISSAYAFGARDFDTKAALAAMVKGAEVVPTPDQLGQGWYEQRPGLADYKSRGYVPNTVRSDISDVNNGASATLEYASADFSLAQFARALGDEDKYRHYLARSHNWTTLYNVHSGYLQPRSDTGAFPAGNPVTTGMTNFGQSGFQEGNAGQYLWMVPHNIAGLFSAIGQDNVQRRLDTFFTESNAGPNRPYYWAGNEVDMLVPWLYNYAGTPHKTQERVHKLLTTMYSNAPGGEPGNDDLGALSSWYVWSAMGLYPTTPGTSTVAISAPIFSSVRIRTQRGVTVIQAPGAAPGKYIKSLTVSGRPSQQTWLPGLSGFNLLQFTLSDKPTDWGKDNPPPSYDAGPLEFPPGVFPVELTVDSTTVTAGAQTAASLNLDVGAGAEPAKPISVQSVNWVAQPVNGLSVTPSSGTVPVAADGSARIDVTVSAAANAKQGFGAIPISLSTPSVALPRLEFPVAVIGPGKTAKACTTLGANNVEFGLAQRELAGDGVTTPVTVGGKEARKTVLRVPNNLNMYFRVERRLAFDGTFTATFDVTYYDSGTHGWQVQYDSVEHPYKSAITVVNQNTNTWKTMTVTVDDAKFAERQNEQTDFRIASDQPVTIHSVQTTITGDGVLPMNLCSGTE
ncbi:GH92 family glycosyl hydrolase [Kibdelosporangium aridum]|uniref:Alpha-1,2-mannosidase, putative n=1 Tax=Kibdelosporangium aridum TaxID=2030 RepID=A0A1Y5Y8F0_KIBAR|nr:GH92 family glycosyl hydrolase [Kibdelosporangium aridum]SMD26160.1 alpha-1,2-mannosidase, putative [Kibdelosporangium aridum]